MSEDRPNNGGGRQGRGSGRGGRRRGGRGGARRRNGSTTGQQSGPGAGQEPMPREVQRRVEGWLEPGEALLIRLTCDLLPEGKFGTEWLVVTDRRLAVFDEDAEAGDPPRLGLGLERLGRVRVDVQGNLGRLFYSATPAEGEEDEAAPRHELVRFTEERAPVYHVLARFLCRAAAGEDPAQLVGPVWRDHLKRVRLQAGLCQECGRPIPKREGRRRRRGGRRRRARSDGTARTCPQCRDKQALLRRLATYLVPYWRTWVLGVALLVLGTVISLLPPLLMASLIDDVLTPAVSGEPPAAASFFARFGEPGSVRLLGVLVVLLLLINVSTAAIGAWRSYLVSWVGQRVLLDLSNQTYAHLQFLDLSFFHNQQTGQVMARVTSDVHRLRDFISSGFQEMLEDILRLVIIVVILFMMEWRLAALVLLPVPLLLVLTQYFRERLRRVYAVLWARHAEISAILADTIPGIRVVKAFVQENREIRRFRRAMQELFGFEMAAVKLQTIFNPSMRFITYLGIIVVWLVGGLAVMGVLTWGITLGVLVAFTQYMLQFFQPVQALLRLTHRFERAATSAERVFEVLDETPEVGVRRRARGAAMPQVAGEVVFEHVTFSYEPGKPVLRDVSFRVAPGEMVGLVGHSGAGKTTIMNLVCAFYHPDEGRVVVDGRDLKEVDLGSYRRQLGVVSQTPYLFNGSVSDNIAYGRQEARHREILGAAKAANAHDFITGFPLAYDTEVGERGVRVSGGERQRLSIARAILKNPRILLLDEATSSVDTETEEKIQEALGRLIAGRTTFAIAHRLSTLRHARRLLVIDQGRLVETGTHDELLALGGIYAGLCEKQQRLSAIRAWSE